MSSQTCSSAGWLDIEPANTALTIEFQIRDQVLSRLKRKGAVVGLSGGIDSSVVAALCVRALGKDRVLGLLMPEKECSDEGRRLGELIANFLGIKWELEDISSILDATGCYRRRDGAIRTLFPEFGPQHKCKLVTPSVESGARYSVPSLVVESPGGTQHKVRLTPQVYFEVVAASNFKQRTRKMVEYYYADRLQYAVAGTPNRLEVDQGFFVKNGDGAADFKPIAHLYKSQVYQIAEYLDLPPEIRNRPSTTDTFSLAQSQEEFFFSVPLRVLDSCLYAKNHHISAARVATATGLCVEKILAIFDMIDSKRRATVYLHEHPLLVEEIKELTIV